ncbi:hypothetical protein DFH09DRAFT_1091380 [Mycena vulgaris]|nr:hypothetical protein DFH09DRAFT_1091380 [Mycena vulgaris]
MFKNDTDLLLKFAACCKILLAGTIDLNALPRAQQLLEDYFTGFIKIIRDFGPVYGFWTFLFEQLNKLFKSYDTDNPGGGELEVTFFPEFHRDTNLRDVIQKLAKKDSFEGLTPQEQCVATSARIIPATHGDSSKTFHLVYNVIFSTTTYNTTYPNIHIAHAADTGYSGDHFFLHGSAHVHTQPSSSLVQLDVSGVRYVGQIYNILTHHQPGLDRPHCLLEIRWMRRCVDFDMAAWNPYPELEILARRIVPVSALLSQASRPTIEHKKQVPGTDSDEDDDSEVDEEAETSTGPTRKIWVTVGLTRMGSYFSSPHLC